MTLSRGNRIEQRGSFFTIEGAVKNIAYKKEGPRVHNGFFLNFGYCEVLFMLASKRCQHFLYQ